MDRIRFGIVGAGWRTAFYLRIARAIPERFEVLGVVVRNKERAQAISDTWNIPTFRTSDEMLAQTNPSFVVSSVSWASAPQVIQDLVKQDMPVLSETPPAKDEQALCELWHAVDGPNARVQIAEQYWAQPHHAARLAFAATGKLGDISQAQLSVAHGYHGINLMRRFLNIGFESPTITARQFISPIIAGPGREGPPSEEKTVESRQVFYFLDYGDKLGIIDFDDEQYFNWFRAQHVLVRGSRGEITDMQATYLKDINTPIRCEFIRHESGPNGNLEGHTLKGIQAGEEWLYRNPFASAALPDEEIAIATCLLRMQEYIEHGKSFYSLAEACQDHYLYCLCERAIANKETIQARPQPWAI